jgi:hypothetical protein
VVLNRTDDDDDKRCPPLVMEPGTIGWKARAVEAVVATTRRRAAVENFMILVSVEIATVPTMEQFRNDRSVSLEGDRIPFPWEAGQFG